MEEGRSVKGWVRVGVRAGGRGAGGARRRRGRVRGRVWAFGSGRSLDDDISGKGRAVATRCSAGDILLCWLSSDGVWKGGMGHLIGVVRFGASRVWELC